MMSPIYKSLSGLRLTSKSYALKFLFVAFFGIHVPLIGLVVAFSFGLSDVSVMKVLIITLVLTLVATGITLYILRSLLTPLDMARTALGDYLENRTVPSLPMEYPDEAGMVLRNVQQTINQLEELLSQQKDLVALISHDMRSPISSVIGMTQLIKTETDRGKVVEACDLLEEEMKKQLNYLDDILAMLSQEQLSLNPGALEVKAIAPIIHGVVSSLDLRAKEKELIVETSLEEGLNWKIQESLFREVLLNLLSNALKFSNRGGRITISAWRLQNGGVAISVRDRGLGFHQEDAEQLFERFSKKGRRGTEGEKTTGMGLYLSRKIVEQHNGQLLAKSEGPGKGSSFEIIFS